MKVLVIGGGGREHALAWKIQQSPECKELWCAPGNTGTEKIAQNINIGVEDMKEIVSFSLATKIDLVIVGPEMPLAEGMADACREERIAVFGPSQKAARIESSKRFSRELMAKYNIPSPAFRSFQNPEDAKDYVRQLAKDGTQCVVKADGLAAGKGAIVTSTPTEADQAIDLCMTKQEFGEAGSTVVIEERLKGPELSILAITDGKRIVILPPSQDHKPIGEGDKGLNTGGMGAYSPVPIVTPELIAQIRREILEPAIQGMEAEGCPYTGVLYAGLMLCDNNPYVIEFNCRFGDPETQAVLPVIEEDLLPLMFDAAHGNLKEDRNIESQGYALCVVMASGGYPGAYEKGKVIHGLEEVEREAEDRVLVFHAGTKRNEQDIITSGGRVLGITGRGASFEEAADNAYRAVEQITFEKAYWRQDIGYRVRNT